MAWSTTLPANSTKIRLTPSVLQANWVAIETGGVPYDTLKLQKQGAAPARSDGFGWVYGLDPGTGFTELYYEDDRATSLKTQITNGAGTPTQGLGATTQLVYASGLRFDTSYSYKATNFITARCSVASDGTPSMALNATASKTGTGEYTVTISSGTLQVNSYQVIATCFETSGGDTAILNLLTKAVVNPATTTVITLNTKRRSDGGLRDTPFEIIIVGGR